MPWDDTARKQHSRDGLRYPSDLTDREWNLIEPLLPPAKSGGRPRTTDLRAVTDAMHYIAASGCQWRMLPKDFPPVSTVRGYFYAWSNSGLWQGLRSSPAPMGRRAHICMAWPLPQARKGLGEINRKLNSLDFHRQHKDHDPQARNILSRLMNF